MKRVITCGAAGLPYQGRLSPQRRAQAPGGRVAVAPGGDFPASERGRRLGEGPWRQAREGGAG